jgi:Na+/H+ antiporter NhaC
MSDSFSLFTIDRLCGQFAAALQHVEWRIYATLMIIIVLSVLLFPPKDDPDQI